MSCDSRRRALWKTLGLKVEEFEAIFRGAQQTAQARPDIPADELNAWAEKTRRLLALFDQHGIPRPVHSRKGDLPRRSATAGYAAVWDAIDAQTPAPTNQKAFKMPHDRPPGSLTGEEITQALTRLGQLAQEQNTQIRLLLTGGAAMVLAYQARLSTHDVDAVSLTQVDAAFIRQLAQTVAGERDWPDDWLNDGAKGYLVGINTGPLVLSAPGIEVYMPSPYQLLAMKLSAWRDELDVADAQRILHAVDRSGGREALWKLIEPYIIPGRELKASYAFGDLWRELYGDD